MGASVALSCQADVTKLDYLLDTHGASAMGQQVREPRCPSYLAYIFSCHLTRGCVQAPCAKLQQQLIDSLARVKGALRGSVSFSEYVLHIALPAIRLWERECRATEACCRQAPASRSGREAPIQLDQRQPSSAALEAEVCPGPHSSSQQGLARQTGQQPSSQRKCPAGASCRVTRG